MRLGSKLIEKNTPGTENISCFNNCNFAEVGPETIVLLKNIYKFSDFNPIRYCWGPFGPTPT